MPTVVRKAERSDVREMAAALARAFYDDPITAWLLPDLATRDRLLPSVFETQLRAVHLRHGEVYTTSDVVAGALWAPPDKWRTPPLALLRSAPRLVWALRRRLPAALSFVQTVERAHPKEPHWYLAVLGTEPSSQGRGIGSALLQPVLDRCDHEGVPAYLESSKEANIPFYSRHGFEVTGVIEVSNGPRVWPMWREPRT
jgi:GNAT superfamily N-acetyltransferase